MIFFCFLNEISVLQASQHETQCSRPASVEWSKGLKIGIKLIEIAPMLGFRSQTLTHYMWCLHCKYPYTKKKLVLTATTMIYIFMLACNFIYLFFSVYLFTIVCCFNCRGRGHKTGQSPSARIRWRGRRKANNRPSVEDTQMVRNEYHFHQKVANISFHWNF